jgi:hypothetical protein
VFREFFGWPVNEIARLARFLVALRHKRGSEKSVCSATESGPPFFKRGTHFATPRDVVMQKSDFCTRRNFPSRR